MNEPKEITQLKESWDTMEKQIAQILISSTITDPYEKAKQITRMITNKSEDGGECPWCRSKIIKYDRNMCKAYAYALTKIAQAVHYKYTNHRGMFREANDINVGKLPGDMKLTHSERCNLTAMRHHGMVAKVKIDDQIQPGRWLITRRGWAFLRGEQVPKTVTTFRNRVINRSQETITIGEVLRDAEYAPTIDTLQKQLAQLPEDLQ